MRITILRGAHQWEAVASAWHEVLSGEPPLSAFHLAEWAEALAEEGQDERARWIIAEDDEGYLAVLPFGVGERRWGPVRLRELWYDRTSDGLVAHRADTRELRTRVLAEMARAGEPIDFVTYVGLRDGRGFARLAAASGRAFTTEHRHGGNSIIPTLKPYDDWLAGTGRNLRASLRKARNRCERTGELTVTTARQADEVATAFDEFVALEASGWKADQGALANRPVEHAVMRRFLSSAAPTGAVAVRTLRLDGRPAAAQVVATAGGTLELMKIAYDDDLAHLSPSNLLMADLVRECCERDDVSRLDLITNQAWHARWHPDLLPTYRLRDTNLRRPGGVAVAVADRVAARRGRDHGGDRDDATPGGPTSESEQVEQTER